VSNTPFKKYKRYMHEGGMITPFIIQWPNGIKPSNQYSNQIGHVIDLMPTALELAGVNAKELPGQSLSYLWNGKSVAPRTYCWEHEGNQAIRQGDWKLVKDQEDPSWELYNLKLDPTETKDLASKEIARVKAMQLEYEAWSIKVGVKPFLSNGKSE
jgi:arylsulfatase